MVKGEKMIDKIKGLIFNYVIPCIALTLIFGLFFISFGSSFDKECKFQDNIYLREVKK